MKKRYILLALCVPALLIGIGQVRGRWIGVSEACACRIFAADWVPPVARLRLGQAILGSEGTLHDSGTEIRLLADGKEVILEHAEGHSLFRTAGAEPPHDPMAKINHRARRNRIQVGIDTIRLSEDRTAIRSLAYLPGNAEPAAIRCTAEVTTGGGPAVVECTAESAAHEPDR